MRIPQNLANATPDTIRQELRRSVEHLRRMLRRQRDVLDELQQLYETLESLPLARGDFGTATNRLRNAHRYLVSAERGAAGYELGMLANSLRPAETLAAGPHLRRREVEG